MIFQKYFLCTSWPNTVDFWRYISKFKKMLRKSFDKIENSWFLWKLFLEDLLTRHRAFLEQFFSKISWRRIVNVLRNIVRGPTDKKSFMFEKEFLNTTWLKFVFFFNRRILWHIFKGLHGYIRPNFFRFF